jgi:hypothetical protein
MEENQETYTNTHSESIAVPPALKRFKFLATKMAETSSTFRSLSAADTVRSLISQYINELPHIMATLQTDSLSFWEQNTAYNKLKPLFEDLLCAPASQAYVERIFSLSGLLCSGRRNRMHKSLEMRVCSKLNQKILKETGFPFI